MHRRTVVACLPLLAPVACTRLAFQPQPALVRTPAELGLGYRDIHVDTSDGVQLHGWFLPATGRPRGTFLFLHGNAENISTHLLAVSWLPSAGYGVLLVDYRGYGRSGGSPSLDGVHEDAKAALDAVQSLPESTPGRLAVLGQSLGGAIAIDVLSGSPDRERFRLLVADSSPASLRRVAREALDRFWLTRPFDTPLSWTIADDWRPIDRVAGLAPLSLLLIAGTADPIVNVDQCARPVRRRPGAQGDLAPRGSWPHPGIAAARDPPAAARQAGDAGDGLMKSRRGSLPVHSARLPGSHAGQEVRSLAASEALEIERPGRPE